MRGWSQAEIWTAYPKQQGEFAFSLLKNVLDRAKCDDFFYTAIINRYEFWNIIVRFKNLKNQNEVENYIGKLSRKDGAGFARVLWSRYQRDHVVPLLVEASKISIRRETLLTPTALYYLVHCIAMTSFLTPRQSAHVWLDLLSNDEKKLFNAYLEGTER